VPVIPPISAGPSPIELEVNRANTAAFINANPVMVTLVPRVRSQSGEGEVWSETAPRVAQKVRLIDQSSAAGPTPGILSSLDGRQRTLEFFLLGEYDAEFGMNDRWTDGDGATWEILDLLPFNGYERRARVVRYG
jgi:hypothetical protein